MAPEYVWRGHCFRMGLAAYCAPGRASTEPDSHLLRGKACHANHFIPAGMTGRNGNGRSRHLQKFCEEFDASLIGSAFDWRCRQREFQRFADHTGDSVFLGARVDSNGEGDTILKYQWKSKSYRRHTAIAITAPTSPRAIKTYKT